MEINKGDKFICIKSVEMDNGDTAYITGHIYNSEHDGCITDESGSIDHVWEPSRCTEDNYLDYFRIIPTEDDKETYDNVNHPSHYANNPKGIECIDAMEAGLGKEAVENFCLCNAFKYIFRNANKNGIEDIKKAIWYLNKYISLHEGV